MSGRDGGAGRLPQQVQGRIVLAVLVGYYVRLFCGLLEQRQEYADDEAVLRWSLVRKTVVWRPLRAFGSTLSANHSHLLSIIYINDVFFAFFVW